MKEGLKQQIIETVNAEYKRLGSIRELEKEYGINRGILSTIISGSGMTISDAAWRKVAQALRLHTDRSWNIVETLNYKMLSTACMDAKRNGIFVAVSNRAGSGKTATLKSVAAGSEDNSIFYIQAREWAKREFLLALCEVCEIDVVGVNSIDGLGRMVCKFFRERASYKPLLIIDEADKLKAPALRFLIPLFNETEGYLGVIVAGTENLEKEIKAGVRFQRKGFDEIDSRFGRNFIHLIGATKKDIQTICQANGIADTKIADRVYEESGPVQKTVNGTMIRVVEDLRRVTRAIQRELLQMVNVEDAILPEALPAN